jgi:hypothetical protein
MGFLPSSLTVNVVHKIDLWSFGQAALIFVGLCFVAVYMLAKWADP